MSRSLLIRVGLVAFLTCQFVGQAAEPASQVVELILREPLDREWAPEWVSIPFEATTGRMHPDQLRLIDENNQAPEHTFQVLTRHPDGSVRSARAFIYTGLKPSETRRFQVVIGPSQRQQPPVRATAEPGDEMVLASDLIEIRTAGGSRTFNPPLSPENVPAPVTAVRLPGGAWLGTGKLSDTGPVSGFETRTDRSVPHRIRHEIRYQLASGASFSIALTVVAHEPVVLIEEDFKDLNTGAFRWDFRPGLNPTHAHGQGRLDPPNQPKVRAGYPIDLNQKWAGKLQPFYAWWPFYGLWWGAYRPAGDYVAVFMTEPPRWLNPKQNLVNVQTGPERIECEFRYRKGTRRWGILAAKSDSALSTSKGGATMVMRAMIRHAQNPLERVKGMQLSWPGMDEIGYPHLLCRPADLPAIREKARTHPLFARVLEKHADQPDDPAGLYLITGDETQARTAINGLTKELRRWTDEVLDGDNYTEGIHDIGYTREMRLLTLVFDAVAGSRSMTAAERNWCLRTFAFHGYCLVDANRWPDVSQGFHRGNINFNSDDYTCRAAVIALLAGHPRQREWMDYVEAEMGKELSASVFPGGAWIEAPNYQGYTMHYLMIAWRLMQLNGFRDFSKEPAFRATMDYLFRIQTPRDVRVGHHLLPTVGDTTTSYHSQSLQNTFAWAAIMGRDDPAFAGRMMHAWKRGGAVLFGAHGLGPGAGWIQPLLLIDPSIPETPPAAPLKSEALPGYGALLRNNFGTEHESYFLFKLGPINQHFDSDEGSFHWYARGRPVSLDFGSMYTPPIEQPWLHSTLDFDRHRSWDRGTLTHFISLRDADFCGGKVSITDVQLVDYDPFHPPPRHRPMPRRSKKHFLDWRREVMFVHGADYVVMRDTIGQPNEIQETGWTVQALASKSVLTGRLARFTGQQGVDLDIFVAEPATATLRESLWAYNAEPAPAWAEPVPRPAVAEKQIALSVRASAGTDYLAVMFPYRHDEKPPEITSTGRGSLKISHGGGDDIVFFGDTPREMESGSVRFHGRAGLIRRRSDAPLVLQVFEGSSISVPEIQARFPGAVRLELRQTSLHGITDGAAGDVILRWTPPLPAKPRLSVDGRALNVSQAPNGEITFPVPEGRHDCEVTY